eukprot:GHVP01024478.1.p1 GENE.GHVP01024478.1~~GHVP01024478.1.p1  ORF type:complete len:114 (-),score=1.33 GHVP01024478.1:34-375(-)
MNATKRGIERESNSQGFTPLEIKTRIFITLAHAGRTAPNLPIGNSSWLKFREFASTIPKPFIADRVLCMFLVLLLFLSWTLVPLVTNHTRHMTTNSLLKLIVQGTKNGYLIKS